MSVKHKLFETLDCSAYRKVFVVGDIHGEFRKLAEQLIDVGFKPKEDILISLGDLVDRGPLSEHFESFIAKPWFRRVLGNHDLQPREYLLGYESAENVSLNGGDWFLNKPREEQERIANLLEDAPLALEVITPGGKRVGITHADVYRFWAWLSGADLYDHDLERSIVNTLTGNRNFINVVLRCPDVDPDRIKVLGIDHVFHGHTPVDKPLTVANRTWIDTDKGEEGGGLSVIDVDEWIDNLSPS